MFAGKFLRPVRLLSVLCMLFGSYGCGDEGDSEPSNFGQFSVLCIFTEGSFFCSDYDSSEYTNDVDNSSGGASGGSLESFRFYEASYTDKNRVRVSSILAVDPTSPDSPLTVDTGTDIQYSASINAGVWGEFVQLPFNLQRRALVYAKTNGRLYKVSALKIDGTPTAVQFSSETAFGDCLVTIYDDYANPNDTAIVYRTPGANGACHDGDDVFKMVHPGMSATDAPVLAKEPVAAVHHEISGALIGWLVNDSGALKRCNYIFANCGTSIRTITNDVVSSLYGFGKIVLEIDNTWYMYDVNANTLATIYSGTAGGFGARPVSDSDKLYFVPGDEPKSIYAAPMDGSSPATALFTDKSDIGDLLLSTDKKKIVFSAGTAIKTVSKSGGAATTVANGSIRSISGNHIYYTKFAAGGVSPIAGVVDDDGSNQFETANADWIGDDIGTSLSLLGNNPYIAPRTIIRAEGHNSLGIGKGFAGGTLRAFSAASNAELGVLGIVPTDIASLICLDFGAKLLCDGSGADQSDVFFLNAEKPGSLVRVTNTPTIFEDTIN